MSKSLMNRRLFNFALLLSIVFLLCPPLTAQTKKGMSNRLLIEVQEQEKKMLAACPPKGRRISYFCYDLCPTNLVKPDYPFEAKRLKIAGQVRIEVIVNETGKVIDARIAEGKPLISQTARRAALRSIFQPRRDCKGSPIRFRGTIIYNFHLRQSWKVFNRTERRPR